MPNWLAISLGIACALWVLGQARMTLMYAGLIPSLVPGSIALIHTSIRSALSFAAFSLVFFFIPWPQNLFYIAIVFAGRAVIDLILFSRNFGFFATYKPGAIFATARRQMYAQKAGNIVFFAALLAVLFYFTRPSLSYLVHWGNKFNWLPVVVLVTAALAFFVTRMSVVWSFRRQPAVPSAITSLYFLSGVALILVTLWATLATAWWSLPLGCASWFVANAPHRDEMESWSSFQRAKLDAEDRG